jgi:hypothetical protein
VEARRASGSLPCGSHCPLNGEIVADRGIRSLPSRFGTAAWRWPRDAFVGTGIGAPGRDLKKSPFCLLTKGNFYVMILLLKRPANCRAFFEPAATPHRVSDSNPEIRISLKINSLATNRPDSGKNVCPDLGFSMANGGVLAKDGHGVPCPYRFERRLDLANVPSERGFTCG